MNRSFLLTLTLVAATPLFAIDVDPRLDKAIRASAPVCGDAKISYETLTMRLPARFKGVLVKVASTRPGCEGQLVAVESPGGGLFLGSPWPLGEEQGTVEQKLTSFTLRNLHESMGVSVDRTANEDGLWPATVTQSTEAGKLPLHGFVDPDGQMFFLGSFRRISGDMAAQRIKALETFVAESPARGAASAPVTIIEFSDFQCPSCRRSSGYVDAILAKHPEKVRYVRFDLPLAGHPWAFPAALAGRAIYRQQPELFWEYKKSVYANQDQLTAFLFWDWARAWAEDHEVDLKKYDADLVDESLKSKILQGAGKAFANDVGATPTYFVNGTVVDYGDEGKALAAYVDQLLAKSE